MDLARSLRRLLVRRESVLIYSTVNALGVDGTRLVQKVRVSFSGRRGLFLFGKCVFLIVLEV